jgi:nitroreductase
MIDRIKNRRSHFTKEFNGEIAPKSLIEEMLQSAIWAPSHKLTLPFRFTVIQPESRENIKDLILNNYLKSNPNPDPIKLEKIDWLSTKVSHIICIIFQPSGVVPEWEEVASLGAAVQNMYLTISESSNFGGYWTTGNGMNSPEVRTYLNLKPDEFHYGYFLVGGINNKRTIANRPSPNITWL